MKLSKLTADVASRYGMRGVILFGFVASIGINLMLTMYLVTAKETHRETFVPPTINKSFWVDGVNLDPAYLEEMGVFLIGLFTNNTPDSAEYNANMLLRYVGTDSYGQLQKTLFANAQELARNNVQTSFTIRGITPRPKEKSVQFAGTFVTYIGATRTSSELRIYQLAFKFANGRLYLSDLRQVNDKESHDFSAGLPTAAAASGAGQ